MSEAISKEISAGKKVIDPTQLQPGDVISLDSIYYMILTEEPMYYRFTIGTSTGVDVQVSAGENNVEHPFPTNLSPETDGLYWIGGLGVDGNFSMMYEYPFGTRRGTPHGVPVFIDSTMASKYDPYPVSIWIKPNTKGGFADNTPSNFVQGAIWAFGMKFKVQVIPATQANALIAQGANFYKGVSTF